MLLATAKTGAGSDWHLLVRTNVLQICNSLRLFDCHVEFRYTNNHKHFWIYHHWPYHILYSKATDPQNIVGIRGYHCRVDIVNENAFYRLYNSRECVPAKEATCS